MEFSLQDDDFGGDYSAPNPTRASVNKRSFDDLEDDEDDVFGSKKGRTKVEEAAPGGTTGMILPLRESLQNCKDDLASCQNELELAKTEMQKWKSAFQNEATKMILEFQQSFEKFKDDRALSQNELETVKAEIEKWETAFEKESFVPSGKKPEPKFVVDYIQTLRASETSLKEQVEIAQMKLAIHDLKDELKLKQESEKKMEEMVEKSESDGDQHHAMHLEILDLKTQLTKTEATLNTFVTSIGLLLRAKGIDPTSLLPTTVINSGVEAARDVEGPAPSPVQSDVPQPVQAEHHSDDQPRA